jgi:signal transduction histidine kinase
MKPGLIAFCVVFALLAGVLVLMVAGPEAIIAAFVLLGILLVILSWGYARRGLPGTRRWKATRPQRLPGPRRPALRTTLFRVVFLALGALFAVVFALQWYSQHQKNENAFFSGTDEAMAQLEFAYRSQPTRSPSDTPGAGALDIGGTGLWIDAAAYKRIKTVVELTQSSGGGSGAFLLDGRDEPFPKAILPPSAYAEWKAAPEDSGINLPSYSFPWQLEKLPQESSQKQERAARKVWLDYLKEHGSRTGWTTEPGTNDRVRFATWRTGADTAYYVTTSSHAGDGNAWYWSLVSWGWQGLWIYILLAPFAGVAAWYLNRRIVRPVAQVAAASAVLAEGDRPEPIPEQGPAELATMARSFNRMSERLAEAEEAQRAFVANVSHELKTPLTSLEGYGELLSDGAVPAAEAGPVILAETARLERLVGDLLDSARLQQGSFSVKHEPVSLRRVVDEVARRYEAAAREFGVELRTDVDAVGEAESDKSPVVLADEDRLLQVVSNLVENALRCTPAGGAVTVRTMPGLISVEDTGPGLEPEDLEHAFERFYLYERCGEDRPVGTGLGLSIVKELTEAMGGEVVVQCERGRGTTFVMRFPPPGQTA